MNQTIIKTPGKLILAGEWSVLEPNNACIVLAINKYVTVTITPASQITITAKDIHLKNITLQTKLTHFEQEKFRLARQAIETSLQYLSTQQINIQNFALNIESEISKIKIKNGTYAKIGLGSSSATVVGIISAILQFHNYDTRTLKIKKIIFKLSAIAHYIAQGNVGSGADIAACTYKQPIIYKRFTEIKPVCQKWPGLQITPIRLPKELILCAGFVGYESSTKQLIPKILNVKENNTHEYNRTIFSINNVVENLISKLQAHDSKENQEQILQLIKKNKDLLKQFYPQLETYELTKLIAIANKFGSSAKFSGAGGGDCGIAICFDKEIATNIKSEWKKEGIYPLDIEVLT